MASARTEIEREAALLAEARAASMFHEGLIRRVPMFTSWFVVSWFGSPEPDGNPKIPGLVRGSHDQKTAEREATFWEKQLLAQSGGLAIFCRAYPVDEAKRLFDLTV